MGLAADPSDPSSVCVGELALVTSIDDSYTLPLLVALTSLLSKLAPTVSARLHLVHRDLSPSNLAAISRVVGVEPVIPDATLMARVPRHAWLPPEAAAPLMLGALLPLDLDRIVFLDADILVLDDLSSLATTDLAGAPFAAAIDSAIPRCSAPRGVRSWVARGIPRDAPYFNAGVMVASLDAWRTTGVTERALGYLQVSADPRGLLHQDALNATSWSDWRRLPDRWNVSGFAGRRSGPPLPEHPAIVHFAGRFKPWRVRIAGPFVAQYLQVLDTLGSVVPRDSRPMRDRILGAYDRHLRERVYPLEHALWQRRLL